MGDARRAVLNGQNGNKREREEEVKLKLVCVEVDGVEEKTVGRNASLPSKGDGGREMNIPDKAAPQ